jgi:hypothetical protein
MILFHGKRVAGPERWCDSSRGRKKKYGTDSCDWRAKCLVVCEEQQQMSIDRNDVKHGIDVAAEKLKEATDKISDKFAETSRNANVKARELGRKTGDTLIEKGTKLKEASE